METPNLCPACEQGYHGPKACYLLTGEWDNPDACSCEECLEFLNESGSFLASLEAAFESARE
jgi:hypothetical protein